jgi:hypothetical protein
MSTVYCVFAANSIGAPEIKASRATMDEALKAAEFELICGADLVWIVDEDGNLILPADQLRARLARAAGAPQGFAS